MRTAVRIIGINVGILLALAVVGELIFGGWVGTNYGTLVIPKDFKRRFDVTHLYDPGTQDGTISYRRDEHGLRGNYAAPSEIDILTIGGSTTNEIFVDEGKTWSDVLGQAFAAEGRELIVVNAGVDGQTTIGHTKNFDLWFPLIPNLKPKFVLAYVGINDRAYVKTGAKSKQDHLEAPRRKIKNYLMNNSAFYTLFRNVRGMLRARRADLVHNMQHFNDVDWVPYPALPDRRTMDLKLRESLDAYAARLRALGQKINALGAKMIVVTQTYGRHRIRDGQLLFPAKDTAKHAATWAELDALNRRAISACMAMDAICVDLANELSFEDGDHYDGLHTTPAGSRKIGRFLHRKLRDLPAFGG